MIFFDKEGFIQKLNYEALKILKYQTQELKNKSLDLILTSKRSKELLNDILKVKGNIRHRKISFLNKENEEIWVLANIIPFQEGVKNGYICLARETGQQRDLEKKLSECQTLGKELMNAVQDGLMILDHKGQIQMVNNGHINLFKLDSNSRVLEAHPSPFSRLDKPDQEVLTKGKAISSIHHGIDKNQNSFYYLKVFHPVKDKAGHTIQFIEYEKDLTTEYLLHESFLNFHQSNELKHLIYNVVHEFKNHLTIIKGYCDLLKIKYPKEDWIGEILHETLWINNKFSNLLNNGQGGEIKPLVFNVEQLLEETLDFLIKKRFIEGFDFTKEYHATSSMVVSNSAHLKLAFVYVLNEIRQMVNSKGEREKITITITKDSQAGELSCSFKVSADALAHNAEHRQLSANITLSRVQEILSPYGGSLQIEEIPGEELKFNLLLPVKQELFQNRVSVGG